VSTAKACHHPDGGSLSATWKLTNGKPDIPWIGGKGALSATN
jgi:hypothetical protein